MLAGSGTGVGIEMLAVGRTAVIEEGEGGSAEVGGVTEEEGDDRLSKVMYYLIFQ
jgi:hypothetical protein